MMRHYYLLDLYYIRRHEKSLVGSELRIPSRLHITDEENVIKSWVCIMEKLPN